MQTHELANYSQLLPTLTAFLSEMITDTTLENSFDRVGCLSPIIVLKWNKSHYVIDGQRRLRYALTQQLDTLPCTEYTLESRSIEDLFQIIWGLHHHRYHHPILFSLLINDIKRYFSSTEVLNLLPYIKLEPHPVNLKKLMQLAHLNPSVLTIMYRRNYSLKQCAQLALYPNEIIQHWVDHSHFLQLSAGQLLTICELCHDLMTRHSWKLDELMNEIQFDKMISDDLSGHERTHRLKSNLQSLHSPTIHSYNNQIENLAAEISEYPIHWDRSLETKQIEVTIPLKDISDLSRPIHWLQSDKTHRVFSSILDLL